jgi:AraC-like DNA-binding protein
MLREEGLDATPLLKQTGIPVTALDDPDYTLERSKELLFIERALDGLDKPGFGLRCGPRYHLSFYGMLGLAAMTSANLTEAYRVIFKHLPMTWTYVYWSLYTEDGVAVINLEPHRDLGGCYQYMIDRGLADENTSYLELVEKVRRNLAAEYLKSTALTIDEVAVRLGYADAPSFSHAFKRWTGKSPGALRERRTAGSA